MKNLKVAKKLGVNFTVVILLTLFASLGSFIGMSSFSNQIDFLMGTTLPNTERIWSIRRNVQSEQRLLLLSLTEKDTSARLGHLRQAQVEAANSKQIFMDLKANSDIDPNLISEVEDSMSAQEPILKELENLVINNTDSNVIYNELVSTLGNELEPILDAETQGLIKITDEQTLLSENKRANVKKQYNVTNMISISSMIIVIALTCLILKKLIKAIMVPLSEIQNASIALSQGDFSNKLTYANNDEFGATCAKMQESFDELRRVIKVIENEVEELSNGNFAISITEEFPGEIQQIQNSMSKLLYKLNEAFGNILVYANQIDQGSNQVSDGAQALAQGSTEQASTIEELSGRIENVSKNVTDNAENARNASALSNESGMLANQTLEDMKQMELAMQDISKKSENISKVIKVIEDIAFQTNILALNAAVEAARAGEAGKGFAVVADEVRNLAGKSAEAAKNTTDLIESSLKTVAEGVKTANATGESFKILADKVRETVQIINNISEASAQQATDIQQISLAVEQITAVVQTNSATGEESAAASEELSSQADLMNQLVSAFRLSNDETAYECISSCTNPETSIETSLEDESGVYTEDNLVDNELDKEFPSNQYLVQDKYEIDDNIDNEEDI